MYTYIGIHFKYNFIPLRLLTRYETSVFGARSMCSRKEAGPAVASGKKSAGREGVFAGFYMFLVSI